MAQVWIEVINKRNRTSKTKRLHIGDQPTSKFSWDGQVGTSMHYKDALDEWQDVDPSLVPTTELGWDWEMRKSHWRLLVKNGGWVGFERRGVGFGYRLEGWTYLNWATKEYDTVREAIYVPPLVDANTLTWPNIFNNVDLQLFVGPDGLGMRIVIPQAVRDAMPPTPYPAEDTFFVFYHEVRWTDVPRIADVETGNRWSNQNEPFEPARGLWLANEEWKVQSCLPLGWAFSAGPAEPVRCKQRFIEKGGKHYLLHGARWDLLKALPAGDITLSFNIDNSFFPPEEY